MTPEMNTVGLGGLQNKVGKGRVSRQATKGDLRLAATRTGTDGPQGAEGTTEVLGTEEAQGGRGQTPPAVPQAVGLRKLSPGVSPSKERDGKAGRRRQSLKGLFLVCF